MVGIFFRKSEVARRASEITALRDVGRYEGAVVRLKKAIEREPRDILSYVAMASTYIMAGREKEARGAAAEPSKINLKSSLKRFAKFHPFKDTSTKDRYIDSFENSG